jgi:hypothetical protein
MLTRTRLQRTLALVVKRNTSINRDFSHTGRKIEYLLGTHRRTVRKPVPPVVVSFPVGRGILLKGYVPRAYQY